MKKIRLLLCVITILVLGGTGSMNHRQAGAEDYTAYVAATTGLDLSSLTQAARGTALRTLFGEPYAAIELLLTVENRDEDLAELYELLSSSLGSQLVDEDRLKGTGGLIDALREKTILARYIRMTSGRRAKTRTIFIYIARDEDGNLYYYQFG